jgi:hypothetical protein
MVTVTLSSNPQYCMELSQCDRNQRPLPRDRQTHIIMQVPIHCTNSDKDINVAFYVRGELPKAEVEAVSDDSSREFSIAATIARSAFELLPQRRYWSWYGLSDMPVKVPFEPVSISTPSISKDVQIASELADALRTETKLRGEVERAFEKAKDYLYHLMGSSFYGCGSQVRDAALFLDACRAREAWSYGDFMDDSRYDELMPYIQHLLGLKNPAHPNVRDSERARRLLFSMHCPKFWRETPPSPSQYRLEWLATV